ncbi:unnamed protein product [Phytomonas sp. Hart1]|nr:unnamed protein product [Phytomonas sp. Hart1]|eukprot:CCW67153.1 unnamed protein product [Phytomonas sp. isolate Hart1]
MLDAAGHQPLTDEKVWIVQIAAAIAQDAQHRLDFQTLSNALILAALFLAAWGLSYRAAGAVELALAAKNTHAILHLYGRVMEESDSPEAQRWNALQRALHMNDSFAIHADDFARIREELLATSTLLGQAILPEPEMNFVLNTGGTLPEPSPNLIPDGVCLSILLASDEPCGTGVDYGIPSSRSMCMVVLHHPDGGLDARLRYTDAAVFRDLALELKRLKQSMREAMSRTEPKAGISTSKDGGCAMSALGDFLARLEQALGPLLEAFEPSLAVLCAKNTLYLCLDPLLQPLPVEHLGFFAKFPSVSRELSVWSVMRKNGPKSIKPSFTPALQVIDPFADHPASLALFATNEHALSKAQVDVLSCTQEKHPLAPAFLRYKLQSTAYNTFVFNGCGAFTAVFTPAILATAQLRQMQNMVIVFDAITPSSERREQRARQSHDAPSSAGGLTPPHVPQEVEMWELSLFLLASGVRFLITTWCPSLPEEHDILCKKMTVALIQGRGTAGENAYGGKIPKDSKRDFRILLYGGKGAATRGR